MAASPGTTRRGQDWSPPGSPASAHRPTPSRATVHLEHVESARRCLAEAEAALQVAALVDTAGDDDVRQEEATDISAAKIARRQLAAASRIRAVVSSRREQSIRCAILRWCERVELLNAVDAVTPAEVVDEDEYLRSLGHDVGRSGTVANVKHEVGGADGGPLLEAVLAHLRPAALQHALSTWSRATAALQMSQTRAAHSASALEGKWALQRAFKMETASAGRLIRGVLRWWQNGDLSKAWATWRSAAQALGSLPQSPSPRSSLGPPSRVGLRGSRVQFQAPGGAVTQERTPPGLGSPHVRVSLS